jgi:hypothetical protein
MFIIASFFFLLLGVGMTFLAKFIYDDFKNYKGYEYAKYGLSGICIGWAIICYFTFVYFLGAVI